jgi:hypothetical protein
MAHLLHLGPRSLEAGLLVQLGELLPCGKGKIDILTTAARAKVHDGGDDGVAVVVDLDLLSAPGVGSGTGHNVVSGLAPERSGKGDDHVSVVELSTASTETTVVVIDGHVNVGVGVASGGASGRRSRGGSGRWGVGSGRCNVSRGSWLGGLDRLGSLDDGRRRLNDWLGLLNYRSGRRRRRGGRSRSGHLRRRCDIGAGGLLWGRRRRRSGGSCSAGGLGLLVEVTGRGGGGLGDGLVVVDSRVDNDGLGNDLSLVDERALVERRSDGEGAEEEGSEDSRGLHFGVCWFVIVLFARSQSWCWRAREWC